MREGDGVPDRVREACAWVVPSFKRGGREPRYKARPRSRNTAY